MRPEHLARAKEVVVAALALPVERRATYLADTCGDDVELRLEVESLLAHDAEVPSAIATGGAAWSDLLSEAVPDLPEPAGRRIGPYELVSVLGEGGMGTVYHARQVEPVQRDVALKLIKRGMDTARVVARFAAERQTLALLDHPGIARILDAGADDRDRPYFVMELVRGTPVTEYADAKRLSIHGRLGLFLQMCHAVQHAHQKGVLHRDLKPSNVLVTEVDGIAQPKVIDFGVARAIEPDRDGQSLLTEVGQIVGTPEYMSPEQAGARPGGADTRSDVYSLGVLLYELLTGRRPLQLRGLPVEDMQHLIAVQEPAKPSADVTGVKDAPGTADVSTRSAARATTPARLSRQLSGDLDNIVLMSLRKEPSRRYAGVEPFAADVRRYLEGRPVEARQDRWSYRAGKFVRRHRAAVIAASTAVAALIIFAASMMWQRNRALSAEQLAEAESETSHQVSRFLVGLFQQANPYVAEGKELSARAMLDQGASRIQTDLADQPEVQAALLTTMSEAYVGLQVPEPALALAQRALEIERGLHGPSHADVATGLVALAAAHASRSNAAEATPLYREALAMRRGVLSPDDPDIAEVLSLLALNLQTRAQMAEAELLYREALAFQRRIQPAGSMAITFALQNLGGVLHGVGKLDEALAMLTESLDHARTGGGGPILTADILSELAVLLKNLKRPVEAEPKYREALEIRERIFGNHAITAQSHNNFGVFLRGEGKAEAGLVHTRRALEIYKTAFGESHLDVGIAYSNLAAALRSLNRLDEAEASFKSALASVASSMGTKYWVYGQVQYSYSQLLRSTGRMAEAEPLMVAGYEGIRDGLGKDSRRALIAAEGVADFYKAWGKPAREAAYRALLPPRSGG